VSEVRGGLFPDEEHSFSKDAPPPSAAPYSSPSLGRAVAGGAERDPEAAGAACIPIRPLRPIK
jgi:hypothetical protein